MPPPWSWRASYREPSWSMTATLAASGRRVRTTQVPSPAGCVPSTAYGSCDQPSTMARRSSPLTAAPTPIAGDAAAFLVAAFFAGAAFAAFFAGAAVVAGAAFLAAVVLAAVV